MRLERFQTVFCALVHLGPPSFIGLYIFSFLKTGDVIFFPNGGCGSLIHTVWDQAVCACSLIIGCYYCMKWPESKRLILSDFPQLCSRFFSFDVRILQVCTWYFDVQILIWVCTVYIVQVAPGICTLGAEIDVWVGIISRVCLHTMFFPWFSRVCLYLSSLYSRKSSTRVPHKCKAHSVV